MRARAAGRERPASTHPLSPLEIVETAVPEDEREREFTIERRSALSPAPGLPGVLR